MTPLFCRVQREDGFLRFPPNPPFLRVNPFFLSPPPPPPPPPRANGFLDLPLFFRRQPRRRAVFPTPRSPPPPSARHRGFLLCLWLPPLLFGPQQLIEITAVFFVVGSVGDGLPPKCVVFLFPPNPSPPLGTKALPRCLFPSASLIFFSRTRSHLASAAPAAP